MYRLLAALLVVFSLGLVACDESSTPSSGPNQVSNPDEHHAAKEKAAAESQPATTESSPTTQPSGRANDSGAPVAMATRAPADATVVNTKCPVSGETLDPAKTTVKFVVDDKTYGLCCKDCIKKFTANPQKYLASIQ